MKYFLHILLKTEYAPPGSGAYSVLNTDYLCKNYFLQIMFITYPSATLQGRPVQATLESNYERH